MQKLRFYIFLKNELLAIFIGILLLRGPMRMGKNSPHDFDGNLGQSNAHVDIFESSFNILIFRGFYPTLLFKWNIMGYYARQWTLMYNEWG